jgi:hypothetical protein
MENVNIPLVKDVFGREIKTNCFVAAAIMSNKQGGIRIGKVKRITEYGNVTIDMGKPFSKWKQRTTTTVGTGRILIIDSDSLPSEFVALFGDQTDNY